MQFLRATSYRPNCASVQNSRRQSSAILMSLSAPTNLKLAARRKCYVDLAIFLCWASVRVFPRKPTTIAFERNSPSGSSTGRNNFRRPPFHRQFHQFDTMFSVDLERASILGCFVRLSFLTTLLNILVHNQNSTAELSCLPGMSPSSNSLGHSIF